METPITRRSRPRHVPTPKMSERKKSLFIDLGRRTPSIAIDEDSDLGPMSPLQLSCSPPDSRYTYEPSNSQCRMQTVAKNFNVRTTFTNILQEMSPKHQCSNDENLFNNKNTEILDLVDMDLVQKTAHKTPSEQMLHGEQPGISFRKNSMFVCLTRTPISKSLTRNTRVNHEKRENGELNQENLTVGTKSKKVDLPTPKARTSLSFDEFISAKNFYSKPSCSDTEQPLKNNKSSSTSCSRMSTQISPSILSTLSANRRRSLNTPTVSHNSNRNRSTFGTINKGVKKHKIKRKSLTKSSRKPTDLSVFETKIMLARLKVLKKSILCDKTEEDREDTQISLNQIRRMNNILINMKNPIELAKPLSTVVTCNSGAMSSKTMPKSVDENIENELEVEESENKKFFKSNRESRKNDFKMKAVVVNGKITIVREESHTRCENQQIFESDGEFDLSAEHREVDDIITKLTLQTATVTSTSQESEENDENLDPAAKVDDEIYLRYRSQIPYNTNDPLIIQQQEELLDFLVLNNILTEANFRIFIMEPEKYQSEADEIINQFIVVDNSVQENELNKIIAIPLSPTSQISTMTSVLALEESDIVIPSSQPQPLHVPSSPTIPDLDSDRNLHPVFRVGAVKHKIDGTPPKSSKAKTRRLWSAIGQQYQIDAGQKSYGARECPECGLLYSVHEPEEEIIHEKFHKSMQILLFRGWQQENVVALVYEWGVDGRILAIGNTDSKVKLNRVLEIMDVVDADLGFVNVPLNPKSIVYLAVSKGRVMGLCVAMPKTHAHRLIEVEGGDLFSMETYPVKCGISKIWVALPFRRQGVASRLVNAVRSHFIFAHYLDYEEIAFSSPTESGKLLAKMLTKRSDFLVYMN